MSGAKQRVLFLCRHNSARSQMAEGLLRNLGGDQFEAYSAGTDVTQVRPLAIRAMTELGIDISVQESKTLDRYLNEPFDAVVTVCDQGQRGLSCVLRRQGALALELSRSEQSRGIRGTTARGLSTGARRHPRAHRARVTATLRLAMGARLAEVGRAYGRVIASPSYFPLGAGQLISNLGDTLHYIALVVLVFQMTGQGLAVAGLVAAEVLPALILGPVAGVVIDRMSRKAVLIGSDLFRAALVITLIWPQGVWHAYAVAAGLAAGNTFFNPTVQAVIPVLTTEEQRLAANSFGWSTGRLVQILASAVAGGIIAIVGTGPAFAINSASFVVSALLITMLRVPAHAGQLGAGTKRGLVSYFADVLNGLGFARKDRFVSRVVLVQALASFATGATGAMLVVLSERHLQLPPAGFAWLIGAIGVGALLGPLIPNTLAHDYRDAHWLFVPYVIRGVGDVLIAIFTPLPIALALLFIYGLNTSTGMVVFNSTVQGAVPDAMRGRVFTLLDVTWSAMRLVSLAVGGLIVDAVGVEPLFWAGGALLAIAGVLGLRLLGNFNLRAPIYAQATSR